MPFQIVELALDSNDNVVERKVVPYPYRTREEAVRGDSMNNTTLLWGAVVVGLACLALAGMYWFVPAGSLPTFAPGFVEGSTHVHVKHGVIFLILALVLLGFAYTKRP